MDTESGENMDTETLNKSLESDKMDTEAGTKSLEEGKVDIKVDEPGNKRYEEKKYDWNETIQNYVKITVIGESGCGKSSLILAARNEIFPHPHEKFVSKQYPLDIEVNGVTEKCMVAEVKAGEEHLGSREKIYSETDVVLLCFRDIDAFVDVEKKWVDELKNHIPDVPVLLVKIKTKLGNERLFSEDTEFEAYSGLLECCPHQRKNTLEVFREAFKKAQGREIRLKK